MRREIKNILILRGLYEMQAHALNALQSLDYPDKDKSYDAIFKLDPKIIIKGMKI